MTAEESPQDNIIIDQALEQFWETVPPLWSNIRAYIRVLAMKKFEISVEQFHTLRYIRRGHWSVSELAEAKNISRPAISQAVDTLVNRGLVIRTQNNQDRRYIQLELTPAGNALLDSIFQETRIWMKTSLSSFSQEQLDAFISALEVLKKMLTSLP